jgi:hypothetical protein
VSLLVTLSRTMQPWLTLVRSVMSIDHIADLASAVDERVYTPEMVKMSLCMRMAVLERQIEERLCQNHAFDFRSQQSKQPHQDLEGNFSSDSDGLEKHRTAVDSSWSSRVFLETPTGLAW